MPMEIRAARARDVGGARSLQCEAFAIQDGESVSHPGSRDELRVVVAGERVVSCLTLIHASLHFGGAILSMGGIRHVATAPDERNQGFASALMKDALLWMRRRGLMTS